MKRWAVMRVISFHATLCVFGTAGSALVSAQSPGAMVLVASRASPIGSVTKAEAKKIMLGQTTAWPSGQKIMVVLRGQPSLDRDLMLTKICGMSESDYMRYEMQVMFTGRSAARLHDEPNDSAIKDLIKGNPSAIGFVHAVEVDKDLKVLLAIN